MIIYLITTILKHPSILHHLPNAILKHRSNKFLTATTTVGCGSSNRFFPQLFKFFSKFRKLHKSNKFIV